MTEQVASTAPTINTEVARNLATITTASHVVWSEVIIQLCDAVDTLRKQFAAQQIYINAMERRWNDVPHGQDCNKTATHPCDCWKAS